MDVQPAVLIAHILTALTIQLARLLTAVMTLPLLAPNTEELGTVLIVNTAQRLLIAVRRPTAALITPWLVRKRGEPGMGVYVRCRIQAVPAVSPRIPPRQGGYSRE
mgnify:CR=1 FL=1